MREGDRLERRWSLDFKMHLFILHHLLTSSIKIGIEASLSLPLYAYAVSVTLSSLCNTLKISYKNSMPTKFVRSLGEYALIFSISVIFTIKLITSVVFSPIT